MTFSETSPEIDSTMTDDMFSTTVVDSDPTTPEEMYFDTSVDIIYDVLSMTSLEIT